MPYRMLPQEPDPLATLSTPPRRSGAGAILAASAALHIGVLGALACSYREPPKPSVAVVRVLTAEVRGGVDGPMTIELTGFRRARVRAPE